MGVCVVFYRSQEGIVTFTTTSTITSSIVTGRSYRCLLPRAITCHAVNTVFDFIFFLNATSHFFQISASTFLHDCRFVLCSLSSRRDGLRLQKPSKGFPTATELGEDVFIMIHGTTAEYPRQSPIPACDRSDHTEHVSGHCHNHMLPAVSPNFSASSPIYPDGIASPADSSFQLISCSRFADNLGTVVISFDILFTSQQLCVFIIPPPQNISFLSHAQILPSNLL